MKRDLRRVWGIVGLLIWMAAWTSPVAQARSIARWVELDPPGAVLANELVTIQAQGAPGMLVQFLYHARDGQPDTLLSDDRWTVMGTVGDTATPGAYRLPYIFPAVGRYWVTAKEIANTARATKDVTVIDQVINYHVDLLLATGVAEKRQTSVHIQGMGVDQTITYGAEQNTPVGKATLGDVWNANQRAIPEKARLEVDLPPGSYEMTIAVGAESRSVRFQTAGTQILNLEYGLYYEMTLSEMIFSSAPLTLTANQNLLVEGYADPLILSAQRFAEELKPGATVHVTLYKNGVATSDGIIGTPVVIAGEPAQLSFQVQSGLPRGFYEIGVTIGGGREQRGILAISERPAVKVTLPSRIMTGEKRRISAEVATTPDNPIQYALFWVQKATRPTPGNSQWVFIGRDSNPLDGFSVQWTPPDENPYWVSASAVDWYGIGTTDIATVEARTGARLDTQSAVVGKPVTLIAKGTPGLRVRFGYQMKSSDSLAPGPDSSWSTIGTVTDTESPGEYRLTHTFTASGPYWISLMYAKDGQEFHWSTTSPLTVASHLSDYRVTGRVSLCSQLKPEVVVRVTQDGHTVAQGRYQEPAWMGTIAVSDAKDRNGAAIPGQVAFDITRLLPGAYELTVTDGMVTKRISFHTAEDEIYDSGHGFAFSATLDDINLENLSDGPDVCLLPVRWQSKGIRVR